MFIDEATITVQAGKGGNGCMAFRREKFVPQGGPFGGNGGNGSSIILKADEGLNTLIDLKYKKIIKGTNGENGLGKGRHGKNAKNIIIKVPVGTIIKEKETNKILADLIKNNQEIIIVEGGRGGRGNMAFATSANPAPKIAENGEAGEVKEIKLELRLLADVGLVGLPNVGKSTLISKISNSKPKIANYPWTTLTPNLGVVQTIDNRSFVVADLPGLIEGASLGRGLGIQFLKHISRTKVIAHVIDISVIDEKDPAKTYNLINKELKEFDPNILKKPQIIVANKMDMPNSKENLKLLKQAIKKPIIEISALTNKGLDILSLKLADEIGKIKKLEQNEDLNIEHQKSNNHILYKYKKETPFKITKQNNIWIISGMEIEKIVQMTRFQTEDEIKRFNYKIRKMGIEEELRKLGIQEGEIIKILDLEFEYKI